MRISIGLEKKGGAKVDKAAGRRLGPHPNRVRLGRLNRTVVWLEAKGSGGLLDDGTSCLFLQSLVYGRILPQPISPPMTQCWRHCIQVANFVYFTPSLVREFKFGRPSLGSMARVTIFKKIIFLIKYWVGMVLFLFIVGLIWCFFI